MWRRAYRGGSHSAEERQEGPHDACSEQSGTTEVSPSPWAYIATARGLEYISCLLVYPLCHMRQWVVNKEGTKLDQAKSTKYKSAHREKLKVMIEMLIQLVCSDAVLHLT